MITLTPQARAIAAFTVSVALVAGYLNRISFAITLVFADALPSGRGGTLIAGLFLIAVATAVLGYAVVTAGSQTGGWELSLAQAATALAALGLLMAVLSTLGAVVHDSGSLPFGLVGGGLFTG